MSRLSYRIVALTIVTFVVGIFFITAMLTRDELSRTSQSIFDTGIVFAELTAPSLYQNYLTATSEGSLSFKAILAERLSRNPNIVSITMAGANGLVIFDSDDLKQGATPGRTNTGEQRYITDPESVAMLQQETTAHRTYAVGNDTFTEIVVPISETTGTHALSMRYILSYRELQTRRQSIVGRVLALTSPLALIAAILSIGLALSITRPLKRMADLASRIGSGDFTGNASTDAPGELGILATSLNGMSKELSLSREKDILHREELSLQVVQLEAAKKKLEKSLDELSRFHRATLDRELRIKELKDENAQLKKSLPAGLPPQPHIGTDPSSHDNTG